MNRYELLYIIAPTITENEAPAEAEKITSLVTSQGGQVSQDVDLGKKRLAYQIGKHASGYYRLVEFNAETTMLKTLNEQLHLNQLVLRHLIVDKPIKSQAVLNRERALRERLAARRSRVESAAAKATLPASPPISGEEIDHQLAKLVEETPEV